MDYAEQQGFFNYIYQITGANYKHIHKQNHPAPVLRLQLQLFPIMAVLNGPSEDSGEDSLRHDTT